MVQEKMRYIFASGTDFKNRQLTGAHKRFIELVNSVAKNNEVSLVSFPYEGFSKENVINYPICKKIGLFLPKHISEFLTVLKYLRKYKSTIKYDHAVSFGAMISICYSVAGIKKITTLFREDIVGYQEAVNASKLKILYFYLLETFAIKVSEKIIVQCMHDKNELLKRHKGIEKKVFIQGNNLNTSWNQGINQSRKQNSIPQLLFIGNFSDNRKGHHLLFPAIVQLLEEKIKFELYVLGDGKDLKKYEERYKKFGDIHFLGHLNNIRNYLEKCDIEIVPSVIDSCPNTVLEGLNAGLVVYGSNTGGIPDLLENPAYMFEPKVEKIFLFLKHKLETKEYVKDKIKQNSLRDKFIFDWGLAVERIITAK